MAAACALPRGAVAIVSDVVLACRAAFRPGVFPDVSRTGRWSDVGHYTQIIWPETQEVGCATALNASHEVLVCRYWPAGNVIGYRLDPQTPFNLSTNNDIVGGNSGSALISAKGEIVGLVFDGNIHSISGSYWFDTAKNRSVAVHPAIIRTALTQVYQAQALATELGLAKR